MYYVALLLYNAEGSHVLVQPYKSKDTKNPIRFLPHYSLNSEQKEMDEIDVLYTIDQNQIQSGLVPETIAYIHNYILPDPHQENTQLHVSLYTAETNGSIPQDITALRRNYSNNEHTIQSNTTEKFSQKVDIHP